MASEARGPVLVPPRVPLDVLRAHVRAHVEERSLRSVAAAIKVSPTTLRKFIDATGPIHYTTRERLQAWYRRQVARFTEPTLDELNASLDRLLAGFAGPHLGAARAAVIRVVVEVHERFGMPQSTAHRSLAKRVEAEENR